MRGSGRKAPKMQTLYGEPCAGFVWDACPVALLGCISFGKRPILRKRMTSDVRFLNFVSIAAGTLKTAQNRNFFQNVPFLQQLSVVSDFYAFLRSVSFKARTPS